MKDIYEVLQELGIEYEKYDHPPVFTCEEAEKYYSNIEGAQIKNLFLRNKKGKQHYLLVVLSEKTVDLLKIAEIVNDHKLGFASPERLFQYLNLTPGSVSPFGLINDTENHTKVLVDQDILKHEKVHLHPNINTSSLVISVEDLQKYLANCGNEFSFVKI